MREKKEKYAQKRKLIENNVKVILILLLKNISRQEIIHSNILSSMIERYTINSSQ